MHATIARAAGVVDGLCALLGVPLPPPERAALDCAVHMHLLAGFEQADGVRMRSAQLSQITVRRTALGPSADGGAAATASLTSDQPSGAVAFRTTGSFPTSGADLRIDYEFR